MAGNLEFDEDVARQIEMAYSTPDIVGQRASVLSMLMLRPGEHVLDIGVGPGFLAAEMAAEVGAGGRVCGIDVSDEMLAWKTEGTRLYQAIDLMKAFSRAMSCAPWVFRCVFQPGLNGQT